MNLTAAISSASSVNRRSLDVSPSWSGAGRYPGDVQCRNWIPRLRLCSAGVVENISARINTNNYRRCRNLHVNKLINITLCMRGGRVEAASHDLA